MKRKGEREKRRREESCFSPTGLQSLESGWCTGECWPGGSCNFLSIVGLGFAPAERDPEAQLLTLSQEQASKVIKMLTALLNHTLTH